MKRTLLITAISFAFVGQAFCGNAPADDRMFVLVGCTRHQPNDGSMKQSDKDMKKPANNNGQKKSS